MWLKFGDTPYSGHCSLCNKQFSISSGNASQVVSHKKSQSHRKATPSKTQSLLSILPTVHIAHTHGGFEVLTPAMQALKAEIIETLHKTEYNHSFSSAEKDGERYRLIFPGHPATEKYSLHIYCNMVSVRFSNQNKFRTLKMCLTRSDLMKPQLARCSNSMIVNCAIGLQCNEEIVNTYAGSLFMGHCSAANLVHHFYNIVQPLGAKGVQALLHEKEDISILLLGTCSLHPVHTAFKYGISEVDFPFEIFLMT